VWNGIERETDKRADRMYNMRIKVYTYIYVTGQTKGPTERI